MLLQICSFANICNPLPRLPRRVHGGRPRRRRGQRRKGGVCQSARLPWRGLHQRRGGRWVGGAAVPQPYGRRMVAYSICQRASCSVKHSPWHVCCVCARWTAYGFYILPSIEITQHHTTRSARLGGRQRAAPRGGHAVAGRAGRRLVGRAGGCCARRRQDVRGAAGFVGLPGALLPHSRS